MSGKRAAVMMADGFEEVEAITAIDILRRGGVEVLVVSTEKTAEVLGAHNVRLVCDAVIDGFSNGTELFDAVVLPGGGKCAESLKGSVKSRGRLYEIIDKHNESGKVLAAICAAPIALGAAGALNGKRAVCYPGFEKELTGAVYCENESVVRDSNVVTAKAAGAAHLFAFAVLDLLYGDGGEVSSDVKTKMFY